MSNQFKAILPPTSGFCRPLGPRAKASGWIVRHTSNNLHLESLSFGFEYPPGRLIECFLLKEIHVMFLAIFTEFRDSTVRMFELFSKMWKANRAAKIVH